MSLIRVRRDRKKSWIDTKKARSTKKLAFLLAFVVFLIWYLGTSF